MNITIVGTGYVGLVTGTCLSSTGNSVTCLDIDEAKVATLSQGEPTIFEPGLSEMMRRNMQAGRLTFTTDTRVAYEQADIIFICVGTPASGCGSADLTSVIKAAERIADVAESSPTRERLVVVKSTVPVGTTQRVANLIRSRTSVPFRFANNPEFLKEGAAVNDFMKPDRVVCGVEDTETESRLRELYEPFVRQGHPILFMDVPSSEMVKYASNAMLACKISFINEIANLCEHSGADIGAVRGGMCADRRIGNQFLYPGLGYGGSCFPKDTLAVIGMGQTYGFDCKIMAAVHDVNQDQRRHFWRKLIEHFGPDLSGRCLAFWGAAFKPETDDIREAPAITLINSALEAGASVRVFDPVASENLRAEQPRVQIGTDPYEVAEGCDALVICTEWSEFRQVDLGRLAGRLRQPVIFDGRNIYRLEDMDAHGFTYHSVGRPAVRPRTRSDILNSFSRLRGPVQKTGS
ncbi:MAG: UDP-glucose dehydrogenase family protein [Planctomycetota bacterium]